MKVLILGSKEYPFQSSKNFDKNPGGGYEVYVEELAKYLDKNGIKSVIITRKFPNQKEYEKKENINVYRTNYYKSFLVRAPSLNYFAYKKAKEIIEKEKIDLIHANGAFAGFFSTKLKEKFNIPLIFTPHGRGTWGNFPIKQILRKLEEIAFEKANRIIFISKIGRKAWLKNYPNKENILVESALDFEKFNSISKRTWVEPRFCFLGRLDEIKGLYYLSEAFCEVVKKIPSAKLFIGGIGIYEEKMREIFKKNNVLKNVKFFGMVPREKLISFYSKADFFVLPSWERGHPIALLEAMGMEKIIISSLDYIEHNKTGIKVKKKDVKDLTEKMLYSAKNVKKLKKLGKAAKIEAKKHDWNKLIKKYIESYKEVLK